MIFEEIISNYNENNVKKIILLIRLMITKFIIIILNYNNINIFKRSNCFIENYCKHTKFKTIYLL